MIASRWSSCLTPALVGAAALAVAACSNDSPTASNATTNTTPEAFRGTNANYTAARAATNQKSKVFYTYQKELAKIDGQRENLSAKNLVQSPWDATYNGGPVVTGATSWNLYINCATTPAQCWGTGSETPKTFIQDYNVSSMLAVADQYLGEIANGHFGTVNELSANVTFATDTVFMTDLFAILHAASQATTKSGYNQLYHVFLPAGTDMCMDATTCYSPDNPSTFVFCAFHGSVNFGPNWHVLYTVQPYQFVPGCAIGQQTRVIDATASSLEHEFTETITDPDLDAWFNDLTGNEIMDLCFTFRNPEQIGPNMFVVQDMYSNTVHACTDGAF
jgi:hypothetical protein